MWGWISPPPMCVNRHILSLVQCFCFRLQLEVFVLPHLYAQQHVQTGQLYCNHHSLLKGSTLKLHGRVPLPSLSMCSARFPGLHASAFDPSQPGPVLQHGSPRESRGPGLSAGSSGKKPGPQREVRQEKLKSWLLGERRHTAYQRAYQAVVGCMDSRASEDWHLN